ncbi:MAG: undecaprenyl-diphosphate phosphatase [Bacteroidales bacterium]|jgi:undecaprenyl-diphosphatase|nr:undecaprenyl-diphosphate phosphatase [Bacteroidales bacterium]
MSWIQALLLGLLQGFTEFLPVSSSGHLTIAQYFFGLDSAAYNLQFDIIVHAATVCSTIVILWKEISSLFKGVFFTTKWNEDKSYTLKILISMIPVLIVGLFFKDFIENIFGQGLLIVGICLIITAILLTFATFAKPRQKEKIGFFDAIIIGISQMIAILPGLSRSGTTIATGILMGNKKENIAKFSFLMVLIPILGEAFLESLKIIKLDAVSTDLQILPLIIGFFAAFISGCFACKFMINLVKKGKLIWFGLYCFIIGLFLIVYTSIC